MPAASESSAAREARARSSWPQEYARIWAGAWNSRDPKQVIGLMTGDVVYQDDSWPSVMRGPDDVRSWLEALWTAFPDLEFEVPEVYMAPDHSAAALHWVARATHRGQFGGVAATGRRIEVDGADFHLLRDGRMHRVRGIYDNAALLRQLQGGE
ncbi:ester cyclase [Streptomyces alanosinicus]|uniref:Ester cyclase n=1 Tax=Streptomyces alanosinicus TaxID=68171 RepID=A0A918YT45_9ACTN|nr:ester cyclase [Streptomyces alanosinicus]GHE15894.1 hypothetical protein GCM10010339_92020 [Streptomyces alanosinicus]